MGSVIGKGSADDVFVVTEAQRALDDQHRERVRKYMLMMAIRVPALLIAALVFMATENGLLALLIIAISIPLPWAAVLIANDGPARKRGTRRRYRFADDRPVLGDPQLPAPGDESAPPPTRVIDAVSDDEESGSASGSGPGN